MMNIETLRVVTDQDVPTTQAQAWGAKFAAALQAQLAERGCAAGPFEIGALTIEAPASTFASDAHLSVFAQAAAEQLSSRIEIAGGETNMPAAPAKPKDA